MSEDDGLLRMDLRAQITPRELAAIKRELKEVREELEKSNQTILALTFANKVQNAQLREALTRFAKIDLTGSIGNEIAWDILHARAVLGMLEAADGK